MPKYRVYLSAAISTVVEIEADNEDDAIEKAEEELGEPTTCADGTVGWGKGHGADAGGFLTDSASAELVE